MTAVPLSRRPVTTTTPCSNLGDVTLALSQDLEDWQLKWDLALEAVGELRGSVAGAEALLLRSVPGRARLDVEVQRHRVGARARHQRRLVGSLRLRL